MISIAIAEDHDLLRTSIVNLIRDDDNYNVTIQAANGQQLLNMLNPNALPDIVLVDVEMPILDGPETVQLLRQKYANAIKILGLSIHTEVRLINQMLDNGANGYVSKAASAEELFIAFEKLQTIGFYLSHDVSRIIKASQATAHTGIKLNDKEITILNLLFKELTNAEIALEMDIPKNTVDTYRTRMIDKIGVKNTVGLVLYALKNGICKL
jgi:DNA-binding NarL/FixJ family response regulator